MRATCVQTKNTFSITCTSTVQVTQSPDKSFWPLRYILARCNHGRAGATLNRQCCFEWSSVWSKTLEHITIYTWSTLCTRNKKTVLGSTIRINSSCRWKLFCLNDLIEGANKYPEWHALKMFKKYGPRKFPIFKRRTVPPWLPSTWAWKWQIMGNISNRLRHKMHFSAGQPEHKIRRVSWDQCKGQGEIVDKRGGWVGGLGGEISNSSHF